MGVEKKDKSLIKEITIYAFIHLMLMIFAFTIPQITLWISFGFLVLLILVLCSAKWLYI